MHGTLLSGQYTKVNLDSINVIDLLEEFFCCLHKQQDICMAWLIISKVIIKNKTVSAVFSCSLTTDFQL